MQVHVVFLIGICAFARIASAASSPLETIIEEWEVWTFVYACFTKKVHIKSLQCMMNKSLNLFRVNTVSYKCTITRLEAPSKVPLPSVQLFLLKVFLTKLKLLHYPSQFWNHNHTQKYRLYESSVESFMNLYESLWQMVHNDEQQLPYLSDESFWIQYFTKT